MNIITKNMRRPLLQRALTKAIGIDSLSRIKHRWNNLKRANNFLESRSFHTVIYNSSKLKLIPKYIISRSNSKDKKVLG